MLDLKVTIDRDKAVIDNLGAISANMLNAIKRGLSRIAKGVHREVFDYLSGAGGAGKQQRRKPAEGERTSFTNKSTGRHITFSLLEGAGAYPVPVRRGNLRRLLDYVEPGETKTVADGSTSTAAPDEAVVYDSAEYARVIREGTGSSAKFGPRDYLTDGLERFNQGDRIVKIIEEEIAKEIPE
jgi:hypothetical protein